MIFEIILNRDVNLSHHLLIEEIFTLSTCEKLPGISGEDLTSCVKFDSHAGTLNFHIQEPFFRFTSFMVTQTEELLYFPSLYRRSNVV